MDNFEKVTTGLELCTNVSLDGCLMLCPYKDEVDETYPGFCELVLKLDALKLLKEQQQWILFSEKKPDEDGTYIVVLKEQYTGEMVVTMREYYKSSRLFYICQDEEITHWMPLPKPPKDGEKNG